MTKKLSLITTLIILLTASLAFAVPPSPPSSTTGATINDSAGNGDNTVVYSADKVFDLLALKQAALSLIAGTYTNGYLCKYTAAGTLLDCNVDPAGYQSSDTELTAIADLANGAGALTNDGAGNFSYVAAGAFAVTSITDQTDNTTPATTATLPLAQGGSLIESTVQQIVNAGLAAPAAIGSGTPAAGTFTTLGAGAAGFAVDADGDVTAKSVTISKVSGVAGDMAVYEANSTDTHGAGFRGPASITGDGAYRILFPNARAGGAGQVLAVTNAGESGTGTAADPYIQTGSWIRPSVVVASGAVTQDNGSISSGACSSAIDGGTATGVATTDRIVWNFNGDPTGVTGFAPSASGGLYIIAYPTSDHVNFKMCNNTAGAIDPGSVVLNWMVIR